MKLVMLRPWSLTKDEILRLYEVRDSGHPRVAMVKLLPHLVADYQTPLTPPSYINVLKDDLLVASLIYTPGEK